MGFTLPDSKQVPPWLKWVCHIVEQLLGGGGGTYTKDYNMLAATVKSRNAWKPPTSYISKYLKKVCEGPTWSEPSSDTERAKLLPST